jgi:AmiR/NasT family two-component response regulator
VRLVALTGFGQEADVTRSRESGFEAHLVKPLDMERLTALLDQHAVSVRVGAADR